MSGEFIEYQNQNVYILDLLYISKIYFCYFVNVSLTSDLCNAYVSCIKWLVTCEFRTQEFCYFQQIGKPYLIKMLCNIALERGFAWKCDVI